MRSQFSLSPKDVLLAVTVISFDIAVLELFLPLISGGKFVLASRAEILDGKELSDRLTECGATVMQATPSAWKLLLDAEWKNGADFTILCGGEILSRQLADQLLEGGASLWNLYGPTETTIWSTITRVECAEGQFTGRPINNPNIHPELALTACSSRSTGRALYRRRRYRRGYLNRPELTAERFILNPFSDQPGSRLYRTGGPGSFSAQRKYYFLGRIDTQVKIRGYRVELGEIEAALDQHPGIKESLVALEDPKDEAAKTESEIKGRKTNWLLMWFQTRGNLISACARLSERKAS